MSERKAVKEKNRERKKQFLLRLAPDEYDILVAKAASYNVKISDYLRMLILTGSMKEKSKLSDEQFDRFISELNHLGVNINQITRRVNEKRQADRADFDELEGKYFDLIDLYREWCNY